MKTPHSMTIPCLLLTLLLTGTAMAQETIVTYIRKNGGYTAHKDSAAYTRILRITPNDDGLHELNEYYPNGNVKRHGWVKTADPRRLQFEGLVEMYYNDGVLSEAVHYADNKRIDTASRYYPNGVLKERVAYLESAAGEPDVERSAPDTRLVYYADSLGDIQVQEGEGEAEIEMGEGDVERGRYIDGLREGRWEGTFQQARYQFEEWYEGGVVTKGITTDSLERQYPYDQREIQPEYPGGIRNLMQFVAQNYRYPKEAVQARVSGQVLIGFVIDTAGTPIEFEVVNDLGYGTAAVGIAVIKRSQRWTPGYQRGVPVRVRYMLPIRLNLSTRPAQERSLP